MSSVFSSVFAAAVVLATASATFNAASKQNVVTYWGQGPYQQRLVETCKNPDIDIINIGFIDVFPDQGPGGWPGDNFGNACWGDVYEHNGVNTTLLKTCPYIGEDVTTCQTTYGKKIFLSIGGAYPQDYYIDSNESGANFAEFLWGAFGPSSANTGQPRQVPWGEACVDGFDFDIESEISPAPTNSAGKTIAYKTNGYAAMITHFKNVLFPQDTSKNYYISGAPQCTLPDAHYTTVMKNAWFDFLWIQFYNTPACSARAGIQKLNGKGTNDISFSAWEQSTSLNPNVKYYIGLPASKSASNDATYYLTPAEVQRLVQNFGKTSGFGGIMLWEATYDQNNTICGDEYSVWMKKILNAEAKGTSLDAKTCPTTTSSVATPSSTQSIAHSSTSTVLKSDDNVAGGSITLSHSRSLPSASSFTTYTTICSENGTRVVSKTAEELLR
ncbi:MAG: glycoside hydrolase family 18 protein [Acidomyces sp. 'richmondensis']|nr:MAG: glycoside hydrolase family 18 protein [Acidomyces sp. 'richmondensis']